MESDREGYAEEDDGDEVEVKAAPVKKKKKKSDEVTTAASNEPFAHIPFTFTSRFLYTRTYL
mgnify:FL=1